MEVSHQTRNILAVPLKSKGRIMGVIEVINKKDRSDFNKEDVTLLSAIAAEVTVVIENASLLMEARRQADQFVLLTRLSTILNSTLDALQVRRRAMEAAVELLECETGSLYLIDEKRDELYFEVALGEKGEAVKEIRLKMGEGIAGWVAQEGKSDLVPDTSKDPRWAGRVDKHSKFKTRNMVTVPVKAKGKVIGVLQTINKLGKKFDKEDLRLMESLADQVAIALENARLYEEQRDMFMETAQALATAIEKRDPYTGGHTRRVRDFSMATAKYMKLTPEESELLELAAILHDTGKIGVDDRVLRKPGKLSDSEFEQMKKHPVYGYEILQHVKQLAPAIPGMKHHHERYDGKGYPEGLADGGIPLIARIIAVADTFDAMTSDRPYRKGLSDKTAAKELRRCSGAQFDSAVVKAFLKAYNKGEIVSQYGEREPPKKRAVRKASRK
jgi:HD-GYP domain-containing protein (c-di-GMP phosphodiesterase class II)